MVQATVGAQILGNVAQSVQALQVIGPGKRLEQACPWGHTVLGLGSKTDSNLIRRYETLLIWCHAHLILLLLFVKNVFDEHWLSHSETWSQVTLLCDTP